MVKNKSLAFSPASKNVFVFLKPIILEWGLMESGIPGDHTISVKTQPSSLVGKCWGPKRLPVSKFSAPAVFWEEKEKIETIGSWPLGKPEPADPLELRVRGRVPRS